MGTVTSHIMKTKSEECTSVYKIKNCNKHNN